MGNAVLPLVASVFERPLFEGCRGLGISAVATQLGLGIVDDRLGLPGSIDACAGMGWRTMEYRARSLGSKLKIAPNSLVGALLSCTHDPRIVSRHAGIR